MSRPLAYLLLALAWATPAAAGTEQLTEGPCSPATNGSYNQVRLECSVDPQAMRQWFESFVDELTKKCVGTAVIQIAQNFLHQGVFNGFSPSAQLATPFASIEPLNASTGSVLGLSGLPVDSASLTASLFGLASSTPISSAVQVASTLASSSTSDPSGLTVAGAEAPKIAASSTIGELTSLPPGVSGAMQVASVVEASSTRNLPWLAAGTEVPKNNAYLTPALPATPIVGTQASWTTPALSATPAVGTDLFKNISVLSTAALSGTPPPAPNR